MVNFYPKLQESATTTGEFIFVIDRSGKQCQYTYIDSLRSNSYTMGCLPVCGDNARASASGLSHIQMDKHGITILYHLHQCRTYTS